MSDQLRVSYEESEAIVLAYQMDKLGAVERLLQAYEGFIVQFVNLVNKADFDISHKGQRDFLGLYMKDIRARARIHRYKKYEFAKSELYRMSNSVKEFFKQYSRDDIMQEAVVALLVLGKRYKAVGDGNPRFHTYMQKSFSYQFQRQLQYLVADPVSFCYMTNFSYNDDYYHSDEINPDVDEIVQEQQNTIEKAMDKIDENWVNGDTCGELFDGLSQFERKLLKWYYVDELTDQEIARLTGACRATINRKRLATVAKLAIARSEMREQDY